MLFDKTHPLKASWSGTVIAQGSAVASAGNPAAAATKSKVRRAKDTIATKDATA